MTTQHTPGPWAVDASLCTVHHLLFQHPLDNRNKIASVTSEANARLIAAAPELLEALTSIVEFWDANVPADYLSEQHKAARAAIAKATGAAS